MMERLQNILAHAGVASRRGAAALIESGVVTVDGIVVKEPGARFEDGVQIKVNGKAISAAEKPRTIVLYKPVGVLSTMSDPFGGKTVADLIYGTTDKGEQASCPFKAGRDRTGGTPVPLIQERLVPIGRLDKDSEGLLLMSNDGTLVNELTHPRFNHTKTYLVKVAGRWSAEKLKTLRSPLTLDDGYTIRPVPVEVVQEWENNTRLLRFVLSEGRKRQIRKMCSAAHLVVLTLKRVKVGNFELPSDLQPGEWRDLTDAELKLLRKIDIIYPQMFGFLKKKDKGPVVYKRPEHCISRKNIDPDALKVLYRLSQLGYTAYLVGGGVRDLLMGREPKDFDVGTSAKPNEVKHAFRNCFLIGRRFRLAHIRFGEKVIETATFRQNSQSVGEIIEHAAEGPMEDNTFGTPKTDAFRRDFTINGLFYNIKDFSVIDWVGGMKDIEKKTIRAIGDPEIRFQEDPVRMMRAIKFSARLGFKIEKKTLAAMKKYHHCILNAAVPRVCEEVFRLFTYGHSAEAFLEMYECGMLGDLIPELGRFIDKDGGRKSKTFRYLKVLDAYETMMSEKGFEVSNGLRAAVLMTAMFRAARKDGAGRKIMQYMMQALKMPKATYFTAVLLMESTGRLAISPKKGKQRFIYNRDFLDALDYNRIVLKAEKKSEKILNEWADLYEEKGNKE